MKVYICMDMEGISDVVTSYQLMPNGSSPALQEIREIATREVNAAVQGAFEGGATEVLVNENHWGGEIIPELLDHRAHLFAGKPKRLMTAEALEDYDVQFLIGLHARMGSADGVLDRTVRFQVPNFKEGIRVYMLTVMVHNAGNDPVY